MKQNRLGALFQLSPDDGQVTPVRRPRGHFRINILSVLIVAVSAGTGLTVQFLGSSYVSMETIALTILVAAGAVVVLPALPWWPVVLLAVAGTWVVPAVLSGDAAVPLAAAISAGLLIAPCLGVVDQWDKIVVLRLGRFHRVKGPGVVFLLPMIDSVAGYVDTRIRVTDFSAEKSLTIDTVPVHVDALAFWMIWDAEKAILEVQDYEAAVSLSAQTALRSSIGSNTLTALLSERERLGEEIQHLVDAKTNPWGITIISVEFKEILIPRDLEDALSRQAQAEREREARIILGSTEAQIADSFRRAADVYRDDPTALQLRAMNMIYESMRNRGGLVLAPASALDGMNLGTALGAAAWGAASGVLPGAGNGNDAGVETPESGVATPPDSGPTGATGAGNPTGKDRSDRGGE